MKQNFIILGPQGSGKTTQAELLVEKLKYNYISTGNIIHKIISGDNKFGKELLAYIKNGALVPDEILIKKILFPEMKKADSNKGIIFEGVPRNLFQTKTIEEYFKKNKIPALILIYINVSQKVSLERLTIRKYCTKCGANYKPSDKNYSKNKCSRCLGKLVVREDDKNQSSILHRLDIYNQQTKPVIDYFNHKKRIIKIDGEKSINIIHKEIISKIKRLND